MLISDLMRFSLFAVLHLNLSFGWLITLAIIYICIYIYIYMARARPCDSCQLYMLILLHCQNVTIVLAFFQIWINLKMWWLKVVILLKVLVKRILSSDLAPKIICMYVARLCHYQPQSWLESFMMKLVHLHNVRDDFEWV